MPASTAPRRLDPARFHIVLVEPGDSRNVGAVARAMQNLGFDQLHLVAPPRYHLEDAATTACWAVPLLERARVHASVEQALAPMEHVVGFAARQGHNRPQHLLLADWAVRAAERPQGPTALLFGPEDTGLRQEHLSHCRWLVRIPSTEAYPSFNLAQSVLLALAELSRPAQAAREPLFRDALPTWRDFYQLEHLVEQALLRCRYYKPGTPDPVPEVVKHLLRRMDPDQREMQILLGMFSKLNRALAGEVPVRRLEEEEVPLHSTPE